MAQVQTLSGTSTRRVTFRIDEVLNRFMRAGATNDFRAKIIGATRCSRRISPDVSLLDFRTDKFQLRGIELLWPEHRLRIFKNILFSQRLEKLIPIAGLEPASSRNISE